MSLKKEIVFVPDVKDFYIKCASMIGNFESDMFHVTLDGLCRTYRVESPIEQLFFVAFKVLQKTNYFEELNSINLRGAPEDLYGLTIYPQSEVKPYRVDFLARYNLLEKEPRWAVIECDGHNFHDRTEKERRHEKQRDRFLQSKGYRIFHFTGSEVKNNPFECASEVIAFLTNFPKDEILGAISNYDYE